MGAESLSAFEIHDIGHGVWRIVERGVVNAYLVVGDARAMVVDTGYGNIGLPDIAVGITDLPLIVVNTHAHPDHSGGNDPFGLVYAHRDDIASLAQFGKGGALRTAELADGDVIDLGNRKIEVIHTPGHTAGSLCLYDRTNGYLFTGDTCNRMTWLFLECCAEFGVYYRSLQRLRIYLGEGTVVCPGHNEEGAGDMLEDCLECARRIVAGERGEPYAHRGWNGLNYTYRSVSIVYNPERM